MVVWLLYWTFPWSQYAVEDEIAGVLPGKWHKSKVSACIEFIYNSHRRMVCERDFLHGNGHSASDSFIGTAIDADGKEWPNAKFKSDSYLHIGTSPELHAMKVDGFKVEYDDVGMKECISCLERDWGRPGINPSKRGSERRRRLRAYRWESQEEATVWHSRTPYVREVCRK